MEKNNFEVDVRVKCIKEIISQAQPEYDVQATYVERKDLNSKRGKEETAMRRKDREVTDFDEIIKIVDACEIVRLGLADGEYPYIVPVNFAYEVTEGQLYLYIHGAMAGRKYELLRRNRQCSIEMDIPLDMVCIYEKKDVTMRYRCVMGKATAEFLEGEERQNAIDHIIMARHEETKHFPYNQAAVAHTAVVRLTVTELTAKANVARDSADE